VCGVYIYVCVCEGGLWGWTRQSLGRASSSFHNHMIMMTTTMTL
jgi:hypothetical protein